MLLTMLIEICQVIPWRTQKKFKCYFEGDSKAHKENREKVKEYIFNYVCNSFDKSKKDIIWNVDKFVKLLGSNQEEFNTWHESMCDSLVDICKNTKDINIELKDKSGNCSVKLEDIICHVDKNINSVFTYGQAQKLVNMMLKYLYIYNQCDGNDSFQNVVQFFHVPLDSFVLKEIYSKSNITEIDFKDGKYNKTPWSKIDSYKAYMDCQDTIKDVLEKKDVLKNDNVFMWELENWPFEK